MKKQGVVRLTVFLVILAVMLYVSLFGVSFGVKEILPMATQLKQTKLGLDLTGGFRGRPVHHQRIFKFACQIGMERCQR